MTQAYEIAAWALAHAAIARLRAKEAYENARARMLIEGVDGRNAEEREARIRVSLEEALRLVQQCEEEYILARTLYECEEAKLRARMQEMRSREGSNGENR